jgi:hypothetical protein
MGERFMLSKYTTTASLIAIILSASVPVVFAASTMSTIPSTNSGANMSNTTASDWSTEDRFWRENYSSQPYFNRNVNYNTIQPAYRYGVTAFNQYGGKRFSDIDDAQLRAGWERMHNSSNLSWEQARDATRDAYNRLAERSGSTMGANTGTGGTGVVRGSSTSPNIIANTSGRTGATLGTTTPSNSSANTTMALGAAGATTTPLSNTGATLGNTTAGTTNGLGTAGTNTTNLGSASTTNGLGTARTNTTTLGSAGTSATTNSPAGRSGAAGSMNSGSSSSFAPSSGTTGSSGSSTMR